MLENFCGVKRPKHSYWIYWKIIKLCMMVVTQLDARPHATPLKLIILL